MSPHSPAAVTRQRRWPAAVFRQVARRSGKSAPQEFSGVTGVTAATSPTLKVKEARRSLDRSKSRRTARVPVSIALECAAAAPRCSPVRTRCGRRRGIAWAAVVERYAASRARKCHTCTLEGAAHKLVIRVKPPPQRPPPRVTRPWYGANCCTRTSRDRGARRAATLRRPTCSVHNMRESGYRG